MKLSTYYWSGNSNIHILPQAMGRKINIQLMVMIRWGVRQMKLHTHRHRNTQKHTHIKNEALRLAGYVENVEVITLWVSGELRLLELHRHSHGLRWPEFYSLFLLFVDWITFNSNFHRFDLLIEQNCSDYLLL